MNQPNRLTLMTRFAAFAAATGVTFVLLAGVVSLADDQPMAIAGQPTNRTLAQQELAVQKLAAASDAAEQPLGAIR